MVVARAAGERSEGSSAAKAMMAPRERSRASRRRMTACGARVNGAGQQHEETGESRGTSSEQLDQWLALRRRVGKLTTLKKRSKTR